MKKALLALVGLGLALNASAADEPQNDWYLLTGASYTTGDGYVPEVLGGQGAEYGFGYALGTGWAANQRMNFEIVFTNKVLKPAGTDDVNQYGFEGNGLFFLSRNSRMAPFLLLGAGGVDNNSVPNQGFEMYATAGLGLLSRLGSGANSASLRADVRYYEELGSQSLNDGSVNVALQIPIGTPAPPPPPPAPPVTDRDGDGVNDDMDRCPGTAAGARVDRYGCETDSDGDGVADSSDRCPGTVAGAKVDARGCELDGDGDGVVDRLDKCPASPRGAQVDIHGCEIKDVIKLPGVGFELNSATLTDGSLRVLREAAATLKKHPSIMVEVAGYTDTSGNPAHNLDLSQRRAASVKQFLVAQGWMLDRLTAKGYGPANRSPTMVLALAASRIAV